MSVFDFVILGIIQGITEWLPISSSGHLVLAQELFGLEVPFYYNILVHFATVLVIFLVFYKQIWKIAKAIIKLDFKDEYAKLGFYIILGSIPIGLVGYFLRDPIATLFTDIKVVSIGLLTTAILLFATKFVNENKRLSKSSALIIGVSQALAILPGVSRSGTTISTGLLLGIKKEHITTFSFLLAVPAILGATLVEYSPGIITTGMLIGMVVTVVVGYVTLRVLIKLIQNDKFHYFGWYCLALGLIVLFL